jgi:hypothetical protein
MIRRLLALLSAVVLLLTFAPAVLGVSEMCVTIYEDANGRGDSWPLCNFPSSLHNASLVGDTTGLHNGCVGSWPAINSDWNDCVSSLDYANLPAGYQVQFWSNINYGGFLIACFDADGSYPGVANLGYGLWNDQLSSWRVTGGNCPPIS